VVPPLSDSFGLPRGLLAALCGSEEDLRAAFADGSAADTMRPGPVLAAVTEQVAADLPDLSDDELTGVIHASSPGGAPSSWRTRGPARYRAAAARASSPIWSWPRSY
jgi:hypothetical protein